MANRIIPLILIFTPWVSNAQVIPVNYGDFYLQYDCEIGVPLVAVYETVPDTGNYERSHSFFLDDSLPEGCKQQTSVNTYETQDDGVSYDRGHLVPANHFDHDIAAIEATNVMTNIVPQASSFNRTGAWRKTEKLIECWRDEFDMRVMTTIFWGNDRSNDQFIESHGIPTPVSFRKLIVRLDTQEAVAWDLPNENIPSGELNDYLITDPTITWLISQSIPGIVIRSEPWPEVSCDER